MTAQPHLLCEKGAKAEKEYEPGFSSANKEKSVISSTDGIANKRRKRVKKNPAFLLFSFPDSSSETKKIMRKFERKRHYKLCNTTHLSARFLCRRGW